MSMERMRAYAYGDNNSSDDTRCVLPLPYYGLVPLRIGHRRGAYLGTGFEKILQVVQVGFANMWVGLQRTLTTWPDNDLMLA